MGYVLPSSTDWVTCSWQCHRDRNSGMPGTDYGSGYGAPEYAVDTGTVTTVHNTNGGANGRYIGIMLDDGRETWSLHLSEIWVSVGQRVSRGARIGSTGASGYGDDWYYGPHVHQSLWPGRAWDADTIDFVPYVGDGKGDEDMDANQAAQLNALYATLVVEVNGAAAYSWSQATLNEMRTNVEAPLANVESGRVYFPDAQYYAFTALANNQNAMTAQLNAILAILDPDRAPLELEHPEPVRSADDE